MQRVLCPSKGDDRLAPMSVGAVTIGTQAKWREVAASLFNVERPDDGPGRFASRLNWTYRNEFKEEVLNRRIGRNELNTTQVCLAYVDAQREYYLKNPTGDAVLQYAQKFLSETGKQDGLYWEAGPGEGSSPLGPLVAEARAEGYALEPSAAKPLPYHGYYYRILKAQGKDASGGAYNYMAGDKMIGGFALVAFPAQYGSTGVMTFVVNHDGVVYEKDLGATTEAIAQAMTEYNPDTTWKKL